MKSSPPEFLPLARSEEIITKRIDGELLVYNRLRDEAHCLNETAAAIWKCCDGRTTANEIAELLSKKTGSTIDEKVIWLGLDELRRKHLLMETRANPERATRGLTLPRRPKTKWQGIGQSHVLPQDVTFPAPTRAPPAIRKLNKENSGAD